VVSLRNGILILNTDEHCFLLATDGTGVSASKMLNPAETGYTNGKNWRLLCGKPPSRIGGEKKDFLLLL